MSVKITRDAAHDLASSIKHRVHSRTHGRVWNLDVELSDEQLVLRGRTSTYYTKQLAQHGALEVLAGVPILNAIEVA
jgi:hypothetical protein